MIAFPLFYEDDLISVMYNVGEEHYQPMPGLHTLIAEVGCDTIAIVYDKVGCHVYDGSSFTLILQAEVEIETREVLTEEIAVGQNEIEMTDLSKHYDLGYSSNVTSYGISPRTEHPNEYVYLEVEPVSQLPHEKICWAASVACIANYKTGSSYTASDIVYRTWNYFQDSQLSTEWVVLELKKDCPQYNFVDCEPTPAKIKLNLQNDNPVYVRFESIEGACHACVVYGYNDSESYYIHDPTYGTVLGYLNNYGQVTYCMPELNFFMTPRYGIAVN